MTRLAVFDCDGTLVDGQAHVCDTMEQAFAEAGLSLPDRNEVRRSMGLSLPMAVRRLAPEIDENTNAQLVAAYKEAFFARRLRGAIHEPLYEGIRELLITLREADWRLAVATGKSDRGLQACLEQRRGRDHPLCVRRRAYQATNPLPTFCRTLSGTCSSASQAPDESSFRRNLSVHPSVPSCRSFPEQ